MASSVATLTPEISLRTSGGQVEVVWNKGRQEGVEIQKDSGSGTWQLLALDTRPNYIDTPAATWKYRAIYCQDSQKVGQWSNVADGDQRGGIAIIGRKASLPKRNQRLTNQTQM